MIKRILIANRGEIAARIARTVRRMGLEAVVVYSDADAETLAVREASPADRRNLGPGKASESYLNTDKILRAASAAGADAIHPGYGFLSEDSAFARAVEKAGLVWIGPSPDAMDAVSSKTRAKDLAEKCGVPFVPGFRGEQSVERFAKEAARIGFPVIIKASAGGGGRGIRKVENENELRTQFPLAGAEALNAFGSGELLLEKYVGRSRHIEVQIFGDSTGRVVHLGERDCSVQRRHQKLIEESPSPALTPALREKMTSAAVRLGEACGYRGAGTVEFLLAPDGEYYFLEVNARLQVEHPVTELVTGLDLVEWQIRVARGENLPLTQDQIRFDGHSIQLRLYAEDPYRDYQPQTGHVEAFTFAPGVRTDHFLTERTEVSPFYDALLAKIIVNGKDRAEALSHARQALTQTLVSGLKTNQAFLLQTLDSDFFRQGEAFTQTLDSTSFAEPAAVHAGVALDLASLVELLDRQSTLAGRQAIEGWSNDRFHEAAVAWRNGGGVRLQRLRRHGGKYYVSDSGGTREFEVIEWLSPYLRVQTADGSLAAVVHRLPQATHILIDGELHSFTSALHGPKNSRGSEADADSVPAPMAGTIQAVHAIVGANVKAGQVLAVVEAMKMQLELRAPRDGVVEQVFVEPGGQVRLKQILLRLRTAAPKE